MFSATWLRPSECISCKDTYTCCAKRGFEQCPPRKGVLQLGERYYVSRRNGDDHEHKKAHHARLAQHPPRTPTNYFLLIALWCPNVKCQIHVPRRQHLLQRRAREAAQTTPPPRSKS
eukprot:1333429-Rhodomonas_salina.3